MLQYHTGWRSPQKGHGAVTGSSTGTVLTAAATIDTMGSWVDIGAVAAYTYHQLVISAHVGTAGAADFMFDIGINVSGTRSVLAAGLRLPGLGGARSNGISLTVPLRVPKGTQLSARCQASTASRTMELCLNGIAAGWGGAPGASKIVQLHAGTSSHGTLVTPATANTKTSYQSLIINSTTPYRGQFFIIGPGVETGRAADAAYLMDIAWGNSNRNALLEDIPLTYDSTTDLISPAVIGPICFSAGDEATTLAVRAQSTVVTSGARRIDVAAYGLAPY